MSYRIIHAGASRSFPQAHPFLDASDSAATARVYVGSRAGRAYASDSREHAGQTDGGFILLELGHECLAVHAGERAGAPTANVFGFARFCLGDSEPSQLIELVVPAAADQRALGEAKAAFEAAGFTVAVCGDFPGRIVDRLIRPYYNAVLRRLDEKLASAADLDVTLRLGLGYPEGPIALLERTGLDHHFEVTDALYRALGDAAYAPARRAQVAHERALRVLRDEEPLR
ncbi:3-hydroxyacyl-CoA dehydrogenase family protein [Paraburkholderia sediminicola]|uniref:3-hydroxyacyl-CoA dehydrogenase family protein n=1 Tax=Paraburkholderia sediminicola TaxID=458836 RepID=UPI0038B95D3B